MNEISYHRPREIEFWFELGSNYSYLSALRIEHLAQQAGVAVRWQPFLLGPIFASFGWSTSPFVLQPQKGAYVWDDMRRQCAKYAFPWQRPSVFPRNSVFATRVALHGAREPWIGDFVKAIMRANFARDEDISSEAKVIDALRELALPAMSIIADARSEANKPKLRDQTERARALGVFGAPTFFVGSEMFWGNDRLDDAIELASSPRLLDNESVTRSFNRA
jgi:2-hydroxychromene-2-carboxylate isomerase